MKKQTLKRGVSLALASAMVFSLTACGDGGGNNTGSSSSGEEIPTAAVRSRFLKLNKEHIGYVMDSMRQNTTRIVNIRAYMLSALYNAPLTINQYYTSLVSHDMAHGFQ